MAKKKKPNSPSVRRIQSPYMVFCVLCEHAVALPDGAVNIERIVNRWAILEQPQLPFAISFWAALGFKGLPKENRQRALLQFELVEENRRVSYMEVDLSSQNDELNVIVPVEAFPVVTFGAYRFSVSYGHREIGAYPFLIEPDALPVPHEQHPSESASPNAEQESHPPLDVR